MSTTTKYNYKNHKKKLNYFTQKTRKLNIFLHQQQILSTTKSFKIILTQQ